MKHSTIGLMLALTISLSACAGTKAPAPPPAGGIVDTLATAGAAQLCAALPPAEHASAVTIIKQAQVVDNDTLYQFANNGTLSMIGTFYSWLWSFVHEKVDPTSADAAAWIDTSKRLIRLSVDGCAAGLGLPTQLSGGGELFTRGVRTGGAVPDYGLQPRSHQHELITLIRLSAGHRG